MKLLMVQIVSISGKSGNAVGYLQKYFKGMRIIQWRLLIGHSDTARVYNGILQ